MPFTKSSGLMLGALLVASGCEKEQTETPTKPVASIDKAAAIDPALAKAVAAASAQMPRARSQGGPGEPPPGGIFPPGAADQEIKLGAAPKVTLGSAGSEPRVLLGPTQPKPGWKTQGMVEIATQGDPQQAPLPVQMALSLEASKPKVAAADAGTAAPVTVTAKVTGAKIGVTGVPAELEARFAKIKGTKVEYSVSPEGAGSGFKAELAPGAEGVRDQVRQLSDLLALVTLPFPTQPVGVGAYWMTTTREGVFGLDLVTYRLVKVETVSGDLVTLQVGTKRYATSNRFEFEGLPPDAPRDLAEFESKSDGKLLLKVGEPLPASGNIQSVLAASLLLPGQPGQPGQQPQRGNLTIQTRIALDFRKP
jgi:hypothetical protein